MTHFYKKSLLCLTALAMASGAFADTFEVDGLTYDGDKGVATVSKVPTTQAGGVVIPDTVTYDGTKYAVKAIGAKAFNKCEQITSVILPKTLKSIGDNAFYNCRKLTYINLPESLTTIGKWAFYDCEGITDITIPESVTSIGIGAFRMSGLSSITISQNIKKIEDNTFSYCSLTSITIPEGVSYIGVAAFDNCHRLKSVKLPQTLTGIARTAFQFCDKLESIVIPDQVTSVGEYAFRDCNSLKSATFPKSLKSFYGYAFYNCTSLKEVTLRGDVISCMDGVFQNCDFSDATLYANEEIIEKIKNKEFDYTGWPWAYFGTYRALSSLTITSAGMSTNCSSNDLDFSGRDDIKAYIASGFNPTTGKVLMTRVTEVPAGTGFILKGNEGTYDAKTCESSFVYVNLLAGTLAETEVPATDGTYTNYVLGNGDNGIGFYLSAGGTMQANKAYLHIPNTTAKFNCISLSFDDEDGNTTGFIPVKDLTPSKSANSAIYNISGQRMNKLSKGLNIVGGKKVLVK